MYLQNRNGVTDVENKLMAMGMRGRRNKLENWDWDKHTTVYKTDN